MEFSVIFAGPRDFTQFPVNSIRLALNPDYKVNNVNSKSIPSDFTDIQ